MKLPLSSSLASRLIALAFPCMAGMVQAGSTVYRNLVLADNPLVYYQLDEASGTTAVNSGTLGATHNLTINTTGGSVTVNQSSFGQGGTAFDFGGGFAGTIALPNSLTEWTVEAWVNYDAAKASSSNFLSNDQGGWNDDVLIGIGPENGLTPAGTFGVVQQGNPGSTRDVAGSGILDAGQWYHVAVTGSTSAGALTVFVNGVQVGQDSSLFNGVTFNGADGFGAANHLTIGAARPDSSDGAYRPYDGLLDEVAVYDKVLTSADFLARVNAVPEPSAALLGGLGLLLLLRRRR